MSYYYYYLILIDNKVTVLHDKFEIELYKHCGKVYQRYSRHDSNVIRKLRERSTVDIHS